MERSERYVYAGKTAKIKQLKIKKERGKNHDKATAGLVFASAEKKKKIRRASVAVRGEIFSYGRRQQIFNAGFARVRAK